MKHNDDSEKLASDLTLNREKRDPKRWQVEADRIQKREIEEIPNWFRTQGGCL